jgi:hypothetical protein
MQLLQTQKTIDDPKTVTKFYYSWNVNDATKKTSLTVPVMKQAPLKEEDKAKLKTWEDALRDGEIDEGGEGDTSIKNVQGVGGGGGGGSAKKGE